MACMRNLAAKAVRTRQVKNPNACRSFHAQEHRRVPYIFSLCRGLLGLLEFLCGAAYLPDIDRFARRSCHVTALVAGIDFPSQLPTATAPYFLLGQNLAGAWVIRETTGRRAGLFRTRDAAIKFARDESPTGNFTILHQPEGLELEERRHVSRAA